MRIQACLVAIVAAVSAAAYAQGPVPDREYVVRDNGIRCVRAPCPSMNATEVATGQVRQITGTDLRALALTEPQVTALRDDLYDGRLVVLGRIVRDGEHVTLVVARVLRRAPGAPPPRTRLPQP